MFRIALCDDNEEFLEIEKTVISQYMDSRNMEYQVEQFLGGQALVNLGGKVDGYQLIFLDVEMEGISGLETARRIREHSEVPIAFVTAYFSYSLEGYKVNAVRYILKEKQSFREGIGECLSLVLAQGKQKNSEVVSLGLRGAEREIQVDDLIYIESRHHYCYFHVQEEDGEKVYIKREKLDIIATQIVTKKMFRIHKSCLVNLAFVSGIRRYQLLLVSGETLLIAQSKYLEVEKAYLDYCGRIDGALWGQW